MKFNAYIDDRKHQLTFENQSQHIVATVDDRQYEVSAHYAASGSLVLFHDSEVFECLVHKKQGAQGGFEVHVRGVTYEVRIEDPKRLRSGEAASGHDHGAVKIVASMPGKVVRVLVESGQKVAAGVGIVVVEAMKMQNEMKSPKAGTVISLHAEPGATVNAGDVLAVIE
jgi:biotin carboxyl carrier protein